MSRYRLLCTGSFYLPMATLLYHPHSSSPKVLDPLSASKLCLSNFVNFLNTRVSIATALVVRIEAFLFYLPKLYIGQRNINQRLKAPKSFIESTMMLFTRSCLCLGQIQSAIQLSPQIPLNYYSRFQLSPARLLRPEISIKTSIELLSITHRLRQFLQSPVLAGVYKRNNYRTNW